MPKKTDLQQALTRAYAAGYKAGQGEQNAFLSHLQATNHQLWEELLQLDRISPCNGVLLSRRLAEEIYDCLPNKRSGIAIQFKRQIKETDKHLKRILKILRSCRLQK